jgi:hypothetical protein
MLYLIHKVNKGGIIMKYEVKSNPNEEELLRDIEERLSWAIWDKDRHIKEIRYVPIGVILDKEGRVQAILNNNSNLIK